MNDPHPPAQVKFSQKVLSSVFQRPVRGPFMDRQNPSSGPWNFFSPRYVIFDFLFVKQNLRKKVCRDIS